MIPVFFAPAPEPNAYVLQAPDLRAHFTANSARFEIQGIELTVRFNGANPSPRIEGESPLAGKANMLLGNDPVQWQTNLSTFHKIRYRDLYPGIDMTYAGDRQTIKSEFLVAPHADPKRIRLEYSDADRVSIGVDGALLVQRGGVTLREETPAVFQGGQVIEGHYRLLDDKTVGFEIGAYDRSAPLLIDPLITYSTYLGGSSTTSITGLATDSQGNLYVTGWTAALDFPIHDAIQGSNRGGNDAFVFKLDPTGQTFIYATYIGGAGDDRAAGIAVDASGQAYVTGSTASHNFPLASAIRSSLGGGKDAFVLKLNDVGSQLLYSTYLGGSNVDSGTAIAVDSSGDAYVAGDTLSTDFPVPGAVQSTLGGSTDSFVTKLTAAGAISFSTYLGGSADEHAGGIALGPSGDVYLAGGTFSTNFPTASPIQAANGGSQDAFVARIAADGSHLVYSTYLGGAGGGAGNPEQANAIAVDSAGNAYVAGVTNSSNFPITLGSVQALFTGVQDAFVTSINATGTALVYSTYLGGSSFDWANGIAIDSAGNAYVAGYTSSWNFPVSNAVQPTFDGFYDAFVSILSAAGNALSFSTFLGGTGADQANAIALDPNGNILIGGQTSSTDLPLQNPIQTSNLGGSTGWLARIGVSAPPPQIPSADSVSPSTGTGNTVTFTAQFSDPAGSANLGTVAILINNTASPDRACNISYSPVNGLFTLVNDISSTGGVTVPPGGGSESNSQCTLNGSGSSTSRSGTTLTMTVSITFEPTFAGGKTVYLSAADASVNTGWIARGTWLVVAPPPQPSADSVSPNASTGASQTFTFVFSDTQSANNLTGMAMLFSPSLTFTNTCYIVYDRNQATIALLWDSAAGSSSKPVNSATVLQNSQCSVGAATTAVSGLSDLVTLAITFHGGFGGLKNIYMYAGEPGLNTGWVQRGTYTVAVGGAPQATSVIPASGSGPAQRFSFTVTDPGGSSYITGLAVLIASTFNTANACSLVYDRTSNRVSLAYDNPANGATPVVPGSSTVASNSQCTLSGTNTTVVFGATTVVVTMDLSFNSNFFGAKNVYLLAAEPGINSGWFTAGGWTVTGGAPTADSMTPSSGSGSQPSFSFQVSDSSSAANISGIAMLFTAGSPSNLTNACSLVYNRTNATIGLYSDDATTLNTKGIGSSAALQNSQCAVGFTVMTTAGNSVTLRVNMLFKSPAFSGTKSVYLEALEPGADSGWVSRGSWTVP